MFATRPFQVFSTTDIARQYDYFLATKSSTVKASRLSCQDLPHGCLRNETQAGLRCRQHIHVVNLGVLTESRGQASHLIHTWGDPQGSSGQFRFPVVHLAEWLARWSELEKEAAGNPFALVVMAQLQAQQTTRDSARRLASKTRIARLMYRHLHTRDTFLQMLRIIDWMMALPENLEPAFEQALAEIEKEHSVTYVTSIERRSEARGIEKGLYKGRLEGEAGLLQRQLARKFGPLPNSLQQRILTATPAQLETWSFNILDAHSLNDVFGA
ncbi:DUF4351 domain-containing protein [Alcaligenaceae bacterium]|nr:DUF4351 domain-containing protein [Alcaligenaceae bacterium]